MKSPPEQPSSGPSFASDVRTLPAFLDIAALSSRKTLSDDFRPRVSSSLITFSASCSSSLFFFKNVFLGTTPKRNERQVERLFFLFGHARRGKAWFLSILFYSILFSLSVSLRRAPRFSLLAVDILLRSLALGVLSREKNSPFFFKENFRDS